MSDYEWLVELAAKGLAQRDTYPMPTSVSTPEAFYEVMARAALDAIGLRALLEEVARHEHDLKVDADPPEVNADPPEVDDPPEVNDDPPEVNDGPLEGDDGPPEGDDGPPEEAVAADAGAALSHETVFSSASMQMPVTAPGDLGGEECDAAPRGERTPRKVENARLRR